MSGHLCQKLGCGDTKTEPAYMAGPGGRAYRLYLCKRHKQELEAL